MSILDRVRRFFDGVADGALRRRTFSVVLPIRLSATELESLFVEDRVGQDFSLFKRVPGLLEFRWALFRTKTARQSGAEDAAATHELLLSLAFEGDEDAVLADLLEQPVLQRLLAQSKGFDHKKNALAYFNRRRVRRRAETEEFQSRRLGTEPVARGSETFDTSAYVGFPYGLTPFEREIEDETDWIRKTSDLSQRKQLRVARKERKTLRGAHAKGHGLVEGTFSIPENVPAAYGIGLFACGGESFRLWARPSNGSPDVEPDGKRDLRGLALSIEVPFGRAPAPDGAENFLATHDPSVGFGRQEFILASSPIFFTTDIREFARIFSIFTTLSWFKKAIRASAFALGLAGMRIAKLLPRIFTPPPSHPLNPAFHSASPYLLGDSAIVKYSIELDEPERFADLEPAKGENFLSVVLRKSLGVRAIKLKFFIHALPPESPLFTAADRVKAVEDATLDWNTLGTDRVHVATIELDEQDPTSNERRCLAEEHRFSPWNSLAVHRPIGNLNRARFLIYLDSARVRSLAATNRLSANVIESTRPEVADSAGGRIDAAE
jgi:hypothetical protein